MLENDNKKLKNKRNGENLFTQVFKQLSAYNDPYQPISAILKETCVFFDFGCGFIYETDHANIFHLKEHYVCYNSQLQKNFHLDDFFTDNSIEEIINSAGEIIYFNYRKKGFCSKFMENFNVKTLVIIPVILENRQLIGLVGMMDRRQAIRLHENDINDAGVVLTVLANYVKTRAYQKKLENTQESLTSIMNNMGVDIYVNDYYTHEILFANRSMAAPYGGIEKMLGKRCWQALYSDKTGECEYCPKQRLIDGDGNPTQIYVWDYQRPFDSSWFRVLSAAFTWVDGRLAHIVSSVDITENKNNEKLIYKMAHYDMLTSLPNRRKMSADMTKSIKKMLKEGNSGYIFFLDLDDLKKINDKFGHLEGDELLRQVGNFLQDKNFIPGNVYRHGGDEFIILCENTDIAAAANLADSIVNKFKKEWQLKNQNVKCGISIGAVKFPSDGKTAEELIHEADMAMYEIKRNGKGGFKII